MTVVVNIHEAKTHLSRLLGRVLAGDEIVIAKSGQPMAKIVPIVGPILNRQPGSAKGKLWIAPDFNDPLPEDMLIEFEGVAFDASAA